MSQPLVDLVVGYIKSDNNLRSLDIPSDICKICSNYIDIDFIEITTDYPSCDYDIPFVFKARQINEITLYLGCESYNINNNFIIFHLPYCYINETNEWYRIHGGAGNINGVMAAKHLSYIMKLKYISLSEQRGTFFNQKATNKLNQMYYKGTFGNWNTDSTPKKPTLDLNYLGKGLSANDLEFFKSQSISDMIIVYKPHKK